MHRIVVAKLVREGCFMKLGTLVLMLCFSGLVAAAEPPQAPSRMFEAVDQFSLEGPRDHRVVQEIRERRARAAWQLALLAGPANRSAM